MVRLYVMRAKKCNTVQVTFLIWQSNLLKRMTALRKVKQSHLMKQQMRVAVHHSCELLNGELDMIWTGRLSHKNGTYAPQPLFHLDKCFLWHGELHWIDVWTPLNTICTDICQWKFADNRVEEERLRTGIFLLCAVWVSCGG